MPEDQRDWGLLASSMIQSGLDEAKMNYVELSRRLALLGVRHTNRNIGVKLGDCSFSAAFLLEALVAAGVARIELPIPNAADPHDATGGPPRQQIDPRRPEARRKA